MLYTLKRLLGIIPVLFLVITITFVMMRLAPGGPFDSDRPMPPEVKKSVEAAYHLDEPLTQQYLRYLGQLVHGDLGPSFRYGGRRVNDIIYAAMPASLELGGWALLYATIVGSAAGYFAASRLHSRTDQVVTLVTLLGICLPSFVLGPFLVWGFATKLGWLHASGWHAAKDRILPAISLGTIYSAYITRLVRGGLAQAMQRDFIRTARAKGLRENLILARHAVWEALTPVLSFLGPSAAGMLAGSFVVETLFNVPGMGRFFIQSAVNRDYTLLLGMVLVFAVLLLTMNVLVDVCYTMIDPRLRQK